jgi:hypothetical protein
MRGTNKNENQYNCYKKLLIKKSQDYQAIALGFDLKLLLSIYIFLFSASTFAGCENYEDLQINQRPLYLFCISEDNCSLNFLRVSCTNIHEQFYDFGGLLLQEEINNGKLVKKQAFFMEKPIAKNWNLYSCVDELQKCLKFN